MKCVWEEETDLEFVADETCVEPSKNFKIQETKMLISSVSVYPIMNFESTVNLVYRWTLEQNTYGFTLYNTYCTSFFVVNTVIIA